MTNERVYIDYLRDILKALEKGAQFIEGMSFEQFKEDDKTTFAVCIIGTGDAAHFRKGHPPP